MGGVTDIEERVKENQIEGNKFNLDILSLK